MDIDRGLLMKDAEFVVLNGDQAGLTFALSRGSYCIVRRSAENFDQRRTLVTTGMEQWRLSEEDQKLINAGLSLAPQPSHESVALIDAFDRQDDVAIWDQRLSQPHAIILVDDNSVQIFDMGSRNGTFVNGARVGSAVLVDGDLLRCGTTRMTVHLS